MRFANLRVAFEVKLRYIARCRTGKPDDEPREKGDSANQQLSDTRIFAAKNIRFIEEPTGSGCIGLRKPTSKVM
jgi:hypothetical protein